MEKICASELGACCGVQLLHPANMEVSEFFFLLDSHT